MKEKGKDKAIGRREEILDVALGLIRDVGIGGLSMHRLARELGLTVGALYRYFASRDALVADLERSVVEEVHRALQERLDAFDRACSPNTTRRGLGAIFALLDGYRDWAREQPEHFHLIATMIGDPRPLLTTESGERVMEAVFDLFSMIAARLNEAAAALELDRGDGFQRTIVLWSALQGVMNLRKLERFMDGGPRVEDLADEVVTTLLRGWGASPQPLEEARELASRAPQSQHAMEKAIAASSEDEK